jgi:carboxypeptidase T
MKIFSLLFILISFLISQERYSQVQIPVASTKELQRIADLGIAVDHFDGKIGGNISIFLNESELQELDKAEIIYTITINDWQKFYNERQLQEKVRLTKTTSDVPKYFRYGSMGGFLTYTEVVQQLDSMNLLFPNLITAKTIIGTSIEGRGIYSVMISDNPGTVEPSKPEVLYTALHHAREPEGMMTVIYYMWWLLENYGKDPEATYLVNNRQMYFIPVVNPDGYVYNQTIAPNGGGMHRKNRRNVGTTNKGIDLNRNYGPTYMWNAPNDGSSTSADNETYRGTEPFSEPETQAIRNFMMAHNIKTCLNYHTYSNLLIYPWGYSSTESSDSLLFRLWSYDMSAINRYAIGTDLQTVGYSTRGNSDDYMYGDSSKPRTYAMTPEVGTSEQGIGSNGFWPRLDRIFPQAQENLLQNKLLAHYAGSYLSVKSFTVTNNNIKIQFVNKGLAEVSNPPISFVTSNGIVTPSVNPGNIGSFSEKDVTINFSAANIDGYSSLPVKIYVKNLTGAMLNDSLVFISGSPTMLLNDSANTTSLWSTGSGWGIVTDIVTNSKVFTDSPTGNYAPNSENSLTLISPIDLSSYQYAELKFQTKWSIESTWDFAVVEVSTDNGTSWTSLKTQLSRKGSGRSGSKQPSTTFGYDAFTPGLTWVEQTADLTPFVGNQIRIRFRLSSDAGLQFDGWYLDDIRILGYKSSPNSVDKIRAPYTYSLSQNFPNPFNPATVINFSIEKPSDTSLRIFDVLGKEVAVLVNQFTEAGSYSINFEAKQLSSGIYFYRLTSGNCNSIKKMVVLK